MPHLPDHQTDHDPLLIAAFASGDAEGTDLERAQELVASCDECAALHHDLRSIAVATAAVPAPARTRDFRLTAEQARELRPSGWRRLVASLASPRFAFAAPLGGSLAALGLAGILVAGAASTPIANPTSGTAGGAVPDGGGETGLLGRTADGAGTGASAVAGASAAAPAAGSSAVELQGSAASAGPAGPVLPVDAPRSSGPGVQPGVAAASAGAVPASSAAASATTGSTGGAVPEPPSGTVTDNRYALGAGSKSSGSPATAPTSAETLDRVQVASPPSPLLIGAVVLLLVGGVLFAARSIASRAR